MEHEISVISALQAINALNSDKYNVIPVYISKQGRWYTGLELLEIRNYRDMKALTEKATEVFMRPEYGDYNLYKAKSGLFGGKHQIVAELHVVLPVLHGTNGEDGIFEGLLDTIGIPYAGCNTLSAANGMDKITMKMILRSCGIPVVDYVWFTDKEWFSRRDEIISEVESKLGYPVIVKPANLGSSVGIGKATDRASLIERIDKAEKFSQRLIVEHCIDQLQEINCSVLGDADDHQASVCEEPIKSGEILSYEDKYMGGTKGSHGMQNSDKRIPADLPDDVTERIRKMACDTFRVLSCHGVSRIDLMIDRKDGSVGFGKSLSEQTQEKAVKALSEFLRPEFINRVDEVISFNKLTEENFRAIAGIMLTELHQALLDRGIAFLWDESVIDALVKKSYSVTYGARNLRRTIQKELEDPIAQKIIESFVSPLHTLHATADETGTFTVTGE